MAAPSAIQPFRLAVPQAALDDLHDRLARTRWPDELPGVGWAYGIPLEYVKEPAEYRRTGDDWRAQEARLNEFPQITTTIDGAKVHAIHARSPESDAMPLVITHGWPGSVVEFLKVIGPLTDPRAHGGDPADAFHVVAPSIPGFRLSGPTTDTGWNVRRVANVAVFAADTVLPIRRIAERDNTIVHWSEFERGGHFAAMEQPDLLVADIRTFFRRLR